jgi:hypothetical protein
MTAAAVPFPALTPGQRLHLDVHGYCIVPGVLTPAECEWIASDLKQLRDDLHAQGDGPPVVGTEGPTGQASPVIDHAHFATNSPHHTCAYPLRLSPALLHSLLHD